ncbi:MAG: gluconolactonase [Acidimicrobiia bacterium]|nr:MAG: gluconolactonase [Acidimicrobiia bacterium]
MSTPEITDVTGGLDFPEGPVVLADGTVVVTELFAGRITKVAPDGTKTTLAEPGGSPNGLAIGPDGALYVCNSGGWGYHEVMGMKVPDSRQPPHYSGGRIERVDLATGEVSVLYTACDGNELVGPNDLVFDAHGGFYFTDHGKDRGRVRTLGAIYYATADGSSIREVVFPLESPNGIGLSPDGTRLYAAETHTGRLWAWTLAGPGELVGGASAAAHGGDMLCGLPGMQLFDSLAVDAQGNVVVATLVTGALSVISPAGELLDQIVCGDPLVTNVAFGGADLRTAYVTLSGTGRLARFVYERGGLRLAHTA